MTMETGPGFICPSCHDDHKQGEVCTEPSDSERRHQKIVASFSAALNRHAFYVASKNKSDVVRAKDVSQAFFELVGPCCEKQNAIKEAQSMVDAADGGGQIRLPYNWSQSRHLDL